MISALAFLQAVIIACNSFSYILIDTFSLVHGIDDILNLIKAI
jgi:hypothetical protein